MRGGTILTALALFLVGWLSSSLYAQQHTLNAEFPFIAGAAQERASPQDWIKEDQIHVYNDKVVIEVSDPEWASFVDTNSMDPLIDSGANAIQIIPTSEDMIHVGDVISFKTELVPGTVIHRVIEINKDENGWYAVTQGDNLAKPDPIKVRFKDIKRILVAVIY